MTDSSSLNVVAIESQHNTDSSFLLLRETNAQILQQWSSLENSTSIDKEQTAK